MQDTSPAVEKHLNELYASLTPTERLRIMSSMYDAAIALMAAGIRMKQPEISGLALRIEIFRRMYQDDFSADEMERICAYLIKHNQ